jgi:hypothetical protein
MIMLKFVIACSLGAALPFLETLGLAQDTSPPHRSVGPVHNWHKYQPTQGELNNLDLQDVTRKEAQEIDRMYNQLESTGGHPQVTSNESERADALDETGLAKEINRENQYLDRTLQGICRGC